MCLKENLTERDFERDTAEAMCVRGRNTQTERKKTQRERETT